MAKSTRKLRIYAEEAKKLRTTHWDMDYLSRKELEALYNSASRDQAGSAQNPQRKSTRRRALVIGLGLVALILMSFRIFGFIF